MRSFLLLVLFAATSHGVSADDLPVVKKEFVPFCIVESSYAGVVSELSLVIAPKQTAFPVGSFTCGSYAIEYNETYLCTQTEGEDSVLCTYLLGEIAVAVFAGECGETRSWQAALVEQNDRLNVCRFKRRHLDKSANLIPSQL
ncbi:MAG: hypothetical protein V1716_01030 [Candidatus Uhrbacteria bacterium]